jgi:hypothetical protein
VRYRRHRRSNTCAALVSITRNGAFTSSRGVGTLCPVNRPDPVTAYSGGFIL